MIEGLSAKSLDVGEYLAAGTMKRKLDNILSLLRSLQQCFPKDEAGELSHGPQLVNKIAAVLISAYQDLDELVGNDLPSLNLFRQSTPNERLAALCEDFGAAGVLVEDAEDVMDYLRRTSNQPD